jgi:hypothetical protein
MLKSLLLSLFIISVIGLSCQSQAEESPENYTASIEEQTPKKPELDIDKTRRKAKEALTFCQSKKYNTDFCILIDMSLHSGANRLVIWDFKKDTVDHICLVGHGSGENPWNHDYSKENPMFSNIENSHCSSLGKYRIGERAPSDWGVRIKYVIHGLEKTNSNAASRYVVFHSWERVPDEELYPEGTPEGWGCPIVSLNNFRLIDEKLSAESKSTLMWIYMD